jgi:hypothetical protein
MKGFNINSDEFANPNVWLRMVVENEAEIRKVLTKVRAVPITVNYDLEILLSSEVDIFKCSQAIMDTLWIYKFMYFEHNFMNIDAVILMPDSNSIEINREKNLTSDNPYNIIFASSPTPEIELMVKGIYGYAVTYKFMLNGVPKIWKYHIYQKNIKRVMFIINKEDIIQNIFQLMILVLDVQCLK